MIQAVILDDESKAVEALSWELSHFKDEVKIIASFNNPSKAIKFINNNTIDCLFLDIEMPEMDGFQFLDQLKNIDFAVIITTAYSEYAITALKKEAIDYLLKPVDADDLSKAIQRIKKRIGFNEDKNKLQENLKKLDEKLDKKIKIKLNGKLVFVDAKDILYVKSDGNYATLYFENQAKHVVTKKLKEVKELLPKEGFYRVHNSYIINLKKIKEILKSENTIILKNEERIPVSRQRKIDFLNHI